MKLVLVAALALMSAGCVPRLKPLPPVGAELPPLPVEQVRITTIPPAPGAPPTAQPRVTINASRADVRVLLPALAQIAGVSLILDSTVQGTVGVHFENVPAGEALIAVIDAAGLIIEGEPEKPWRASEFYQAPVNVNTAGAGVISARFGVSPKLAEFIVRSRLPAIPDR